MNKGTGIAEQISPFYGTVIAEHSQYTLLYKVLRHHRIQKFQ